MQTAISASRARGVSLLLIVLVSSCCSSFVLKRFSAVTSSSSTKTSSCRPADNSCTRLSSHRYCHYLPNYLGLRENIPRRTRRRLVVDYSASFGGRSTSTTSRGGIIVRRGRTDDESVDAVVGTTNIETSVTVPLIDGEERVFQMQGAALYNGNDDNNSAQWAKDPFAMVSEKDLMTLTVAQLKQQLRLRGLKVNGKKQQLIQRILVSQQVGNEASALSFEQQQLLQVDTAAKDLTKDEAIAQKYGNKIVDVSEYIEVKEDTDEDDNEEEEGSEVWGTQAKLVQDLDNPVVDNLLRTVVEFVGYQEEQVQAYICASRDALKSYMAGGAKGKSNLSPKQQVFERQRRREKAEGAIDPKKLEGEDDSDHSGFYYINDYSDVGLFTVTGAKVSASEVEGVLLLTEEKFRNEDIRLLCDKIGFECQPCVVMAPDVFQRDEITAPSATDVERIHVNIRASANVLREIYGVSSIVVFGIGLGGGKALEAAAGWSPTFNSTAVLKSNKLLPPPVNPMACVAWYPSVYNAQELFGDKTATLKNNNEVAIMTIFAGEDTHQGAQPSDAAELKTLLESSPLVKDYMVKVFPGQSHGFAHVGLSSETGPVGQQDAEVACLLSTAWFEAYSRVFLPTVGSRVRDSTDEWASQLEMKNIANIPVLDPESINYDDEEWPIDFESLEEEYKEFLNPVSW